MTSNAAPALRADSSGVRGASQLCPCPGDSGALSYLASWTPAARGETHGYDPFGLCYRASGRGAADLDLGDTQLSDQELDELEELIEAARKRNQAAPNKTQSS